MIAGRQKLVESPMAKVRGMAMPLVPLFML